MVTFNEEFYTWLSSQKDSDYGFYVNSPSGTSKQLYVVNYSGQPYTTTPRIEAKFQVNLLNPTLSTADQDIWTLFNKLHQILPFSLITYKVNGIFAIQIPFDLPRKELGNNIYLYHKVFNMIVYYV